MEQIQTNIFDKRELFRNCTVEVLTNTLTGEVSIGWWRNDNPPFGVDEEDIEGVG